jgi:hypothetical protein
MDHQCTKCVLCFDKRLVGLYKEFDRVDIETRKTTIWLFTELVPTTDVDHECTKCVLCFRKRLNDLYVEFGIPRGACFTVMRAFLISL